MAQPATQSRSLKDPRVDPSELIEALGKGWHWPVRPSMLAFPAHGVSPSAVVFVGEHHVAKCLCRPESGEQPSWGKSIFKVEHGVLRALTDELSTSGGTARDVLGVDIPELILPQQETDAALFLMTRVEGVPLASLPHLASNPSIAGQIAQFLIKFDAIGTKRHSTAPSSKPFINALVLRGAPLPDLYAPLLPYLRQARELLDQPPGKTRFMHDDLNLGNILVQPNVNTDTGAVEGHNVGLIDFGDISRGDPHLGLARGLISETAQPFVEQVINELNVRSARTGDPWAMDMRRCVALAPLFVVTNMLSHGPERQTPARIAHTKQRVDRLFTRYGVSLPPGVVASSASKPKDHLPATLGGK